MSSRSLELFDLDEEVDRAVDGVRVLSFRADRVARFDTVWVLVASDTEVASGGDRFALRAGSYAALHGEVRTWGGRGLLIGQDGYRALRQVGGPIEAVGRLRYIDGCTDTLLLGPARLGDPCLNHLHLPAGTDQSTHTHPSVRVGIIARGQGWARSGRAVAPLAAGVGWIIPTGIEHSFATAEVPLDVLAWHPDSDFGPTDEDHPMRNRTLKVARVNVT